MKEKIEEISLSMERGHRRVLRVLSALAVIGLFAALWKWRGLTAMQPLVDGGMDRWTCAVLESIVIALAAQWVLYLLPWPLLAPVRPDGSVLLRVFPAPVRRLEGGAEPRRRACRAAAPARARRRGAVVALARATRVVLARGDGKRRLHRRGAWHGV